MSVRVDDVDYIQYTRRDSVLIGIQQAVTIYSKLVEITLYSRVVKTVLTPPLDGSFDSLLVRNGVVYLGRTVMTRPTESTTLQVHDVVSLSSTYEASPLVSTSGRVGLIEVFIDKGTVTTFVYLPTTKEIKACYPDKTCPTWATVEITGMACGADCRSTIYVSSNTKILRVMSSGLPTILKETGSAIYCLTGISSLNV